MLAGFCRPSSPKQQLRCGVFALFPRFFSKPVEDQGIREWVGKRAERLLLRWIIGPHVLSVEPAVYPKLDRGALAGVEIGRLGHLNQDTHRPFRSPPTVAR